MMQGLLLRMCWQEEVFLLLLVEQGCISAGMLCSITHPLKWQLNFCLYLQYNTFQTPTTVHPGKPLVEHLDF